MSRTRRVSALLAVGLWASAVAGQLQSSGVAPGASDSFGQGEQVLGVGAAAFRELFNDSHYEIDQGQDGYLYAQGTFVAPLVLPAGAQIHRICTHLFDGGGDDLVVTGLEGVKLTDEATGPAVMPIYSHTGGVDGGYGMACSDLSYVYVNTGDVDGDGIVENVVHRLRVVLYDDDLGLQPGLGGVRVFWRSQISPAPVVASFADVPTSHPYFPYVEALAASGITAGCGGGNFCPTEPLTRVQMAIFLSKALGLHWPN